MCNYIHELQFNVYYYFKNFRAKIRFRVGAIWICVRIVIKKKQPLECDKYNCITCNLKFLLLILIAVGLFPALVVEENECH